MVEVEFLKKIIKHSQMREPGDTMELPESTAAKLANAGVVEIPGKEVVEEKEEVDVLKIKDKE